MSSLKPCLIFLFLFFGIICCLQNSLVAQKKYTVSGKVIEKETGESLIGATVSVAESKIGTATNEYGYYSLTLASDSITLYFSYIGLKAKELKVLLTENMTIDMLLSADAELDAVVIEAGSNIEKVNSTQMGLDELSAKEIKEIPVVFGESDILKVLQLKPGVQSGGEGTSGLFVRGGSADQNIFLLDEAPIYNPSHLFGMFSTFNSDAVSNVKLYKAGFPAEFGGKLSSVVEVHLREGNRKRISGTGGVGLISSRFMLEGPIKKDKSSFLISGRRTYVDVVTEIINKINEGKKGTQKIPAYNFYDLNAKFNVDLTPKDRLYVSGYFGRDAFSFKNKTINFNFNWGNIAAAVRWNRMLTPKIFMNNSLTFTDYIYKLSNQFQDFKVELGSGIQDINLKSDYSWAPIPDHAIKFGALATYHRFTVNRFEAGNGQDVNFQAGSTYHAAEFGAYISDDWAISERFKLQTGLRWSSFYNEKLFMGIEPRLAAKYSLNPLLSLKASYTRMYQYIHLVSSSGAALPTDVWYPSNNTVKPQYSDMVSTGVAWAIQKDYFFSGEVYYKWLKNQVDFRDGAQLFVNDNLDQEFVFGTGDNYGLEVYFEKKNGWIRGWIGYTLSWAWRDFPDVMDGSRFPASSDRRHDVSIVATVDVPKTPVTLTFAWIYGTGKAFSLPTERMIVTDVTGENPIRFIPVYTERNGYRLPAYHRMDLGAVVKLWQKKRFKSDLTFSVYNLYNRYNAFFVYIEPQYAPGADEQGGIQIPERFQAKVVTLFPIIPTITWNFEF